MCRKRFTLVAKTYDRKGNLIAVGTNSYKKSHPLQSQLAARVGLPEKKFLHSELSALLRSRDKEVYKLTVERYNSLGDMVMASPCLICREAIKMFGVKQIEYTSLNGWVKEKV